MISTFRIEGPEDLHPEHPVHDVSELASGQLDTSKLRVKSHFTKVFDLMDEEQRSEYDKLYVELSGKSSKGCIVISDNRRETLVRPDGSTGWFKIIEWSEFDISELLGA